MNAKHTYLFSPLKHRNRNIIAGLLLVWSCFYVRMLYPSSSPSSSEVAHTHTDPILLFFMEICNAIALVVYIIWDVHHWKVKLISPLLLFSLLAFYFSFLLTEILFSLSLSLSSLPPSHPQLSDVAHLDLLSVTTSLSQPRKFLRFEFVYVAVIPLIYLYQYFQVSYFGCCQCVWCVLLLQIATFLRKF